MRKTNSWLYVQLVSDLEGKGYTGYFHTLEIGSLGYYKQCAFNCTKRVFYLLSIAAITFETLKNSK